MALFGLFGGSKKKAITLKRGRGFTVNAVGEANFQDALLRLTGGRKLEHGVKQDALATLKAEPSNPHDQNAVIVMISGKKVGYLGREQAGDLSALLKTHGADEATCESRIVGGWLNDSDEGNFGVKLNISLPPKIATKK